MKKLALITSCILLSCNLSLAERSPHLAPTPKPADPKALEAHSKKEGLEKLLIKGKTNQISMDKKGNIFINNKAISMENVDALLHLIGKNGSVALRCDKDAKPAQVAQLIHKVRYSGVKISN